MPGIAAEAKGSIFWSKSAAAERIKNQAPEKHEVSLSIFDPSFPRLEKLLVLDVG